MESGDHCKSDCLMMTMNFKSITRELRAMRDNVGNMSRRGATRKCITRKGKSHIAPECSSISPPLEAPTADLKLQHSGWACLPPELLSDIIQRVEASETSWPGRRAVVASASVCKSWRQATKEVVKTPEQCGWFTFPISLKQPGPRDAPIQCFIRRNRETSTFQLYLGPSPAISRDAALSSKLLLAAKKIRRAAFTDFLISLAPDDFSRTSSAYIGKLRSNFLGTKFTIVDKQPPQHLLGHLNSTSKRQITRNHLSPTYASAKYNVGTISYELNVLRTRGPRRMWCIMHSVMANGIQEGPTPAECTYRNNEQLSILAMSNEDKRIAEGSSSTASEKLELNHSTKPPLILKNKAPRWHEQLQCWCLNFKGRVTVASVKNFQLVTAAESEPDISVTEQDTVILQFGKFGRDIFTMDYRYPLSAFQAFAICLSSFDTKPACE